MTFFIKSKYVGNKKEVYIPPQIQNLPVTSIGNQAFNECVSLTSVEFMGKIFFGNWAFSACSSLTAINVAAGAGNTAYSSSGGILYNKDKTALVAYPGGKHGAFTIPNHVNTIRAGAFGYCTNLLSVAKYGRSNDESFKTFPLCIFSEICYFINKRATLYIDGKIFHS
ncbi:MAG: leucine-rich repeat domain-containing protein [Treponema sp.]|nr:leucine-rich repeat domain-containing protein [Treponema sp.]